MTDQDAKAARIAEIRRYSARDRYWDAADVRFLLAEYDSLAAENARMRPVVEAAIAVRYEPTIDTGTPRRNALLIAVDTYLEGKS
jgi:hypothetical protein